MLRLPDFPQNSLFCLASFSRPRSMSFLNFRSAKRRAKKIVSIRPQRPSTPPSPGSFVSQNVRESTWAFPEVSSIPTTNRIDVDVTHGPLFSSDPFVPGSYRSATESRDFRGGLLPTGPGCNGVSPCKSLPDDVGLEQRRNDPFVKRIVSETSPCPRPPHRTPKAAPSPIKIPTTSHASRVQIQRSAKVTGEPPGSVNPEDSPESLVSGITLPGALVTNVWYVQTDQSRDHRLSRRITRLDSATLPSDDFAFMSSKYGRLGNRDGDSDPPPVPSISAAKFSSREDIGKSHHSQISPIPELSMPSPFNSVTPDLIKDSSTFADEGTSSQPQSSNSAPSAWSGSASGSTPPSGEEITMLLDILSAPRPNSKLASEMTDVPASELDANEPSDLRVPLAEQRQPLGDTRRTSKSPSGSRPSLSSLNNLILHPTTLLPVGERRTSSTRRVSESDRSVSSEDAESISDLPSSLAKVYSHHISQLPSFPSSAFTSGGFPSRSSSRSPSPDLLDNFIIADRSGARRSEHLISGEISIDPGAQLGSRVDSSMSGFSGTQTFPESPSAFSPVFSLNADLARTLQFRDTSELSRESVAGSFRGRSSRVSQKILTRRSVTARASMKLRVHRKLSKKSSKSKLARQSSVRFPVDEVPGGSSSDPECSKAVAATTQPSEPSDNKEPVGPVASDTVGLTSLQRSKLTSRDHSKPRRTKAIIPPAPLTRLLLPSPPLPPPVTAGSPSVLAFPSPRVLLTSPQLRPLSPSPSLRLPPLPPIPLSSDLSSEEQSAHPPNSLPRPTVNHSVASPDNIFATSALPRTIFHSDARRIPARPPLLPNGPRSNFKRGRFGSTESLSRVTLMGARDLTNSSSGFSPSPGPKFQTSPPKFKGVTMEAANWTFSTAELQSIVSKAVEQSAEPSSIRLLTTQAAFTDVPAELERLTSLQNELKVHYRVQARKRDALLRATMAYAETLGSGSSALHERLQELAEITANLDKIAEELYHARDQAGQLSRMLAVHSSSALTMALRKLHASYLRRGTEVKSLQEQLSTMEAERDEAWTQAQQVARDLDDLNDTLRTGDSNPAAATGPSNRSSLVMASRVSSARVSKAGLRMSHTLRASSQIHSGHSSYVSSVGTPGSTSGPPPVPPIPRKLSSLNRIDTSDLSNRSSDLSFSSDTHALAQAQADLYGYLGIDDPDMRLLPVRRSSIAVSPAVSSAGARSSMIRRMSDSADCRTSAIDRPQSY